MDTHAEPSAISVAEIRVVLGRILLQSDSREAEFEGRSMCYRGLRRFMRFLFWLPPDGACQPHKRSFAGIWQRTTGYLRHPMRQYFISSRQAPSRVLC
jgi:hypothetical protein